MPSFKNTPGLFGPGNAPRPDFRSGVTPKAAYNRLTNVANVVNGGVATSSGDINSSFPISAVNNGMRDVAAAGQGWGSGGGWNSAGNNVWPDWAQIDFTASYWIQEIDVITLKDDYTNPHDPLLTDTFTAYGLLSFDVQYWDGGNWVAVPGGNVTGNNKVWRQFQFPPVFTSKIRISVNDSADHTYARIVEVEAWAGPAPYLASVSATGAGTSSLAKQGQKLSKVVSGFNSPLDLPGCRLWLKADSLGLNDNDPVGTWADQSGRGNDASQATAGNKPLFKTNIVNGKPVVRFDGVNDFLSLPNLMNAVPAATAGTQFVVVKIANDPPGVSTKTGPVLGGFGTDVNDSTFPWTTGFLYDAWGSTTRKNAFVNPTPSLTAWRIYAVTSGASDWRDYLDGSLLFSTAVNTVGFGTVPRVGGEYSGSNYLDGDVAEIIVYDQVLSVSDRQKVETYLATKYGLTIATSFLPVVILKQAQKVMSLVSTSVVSVLRRATKLLSLVTSTETASLVKQAKIAPRSAVNRVEELIPSDIGSNDDWDLGRGFDKFSAMWRPDDDDDSYIWSTGARTQNFIPSSPELEIKTVNSVKVRAWVRGNFAGSGSFYLGVLLSGNVTEQNFGTPFGGYAEFITASLAKPGGGSWTYWDIIGLEIQIRNAGGDDVYCSSISVLVDYDGYVPYVPATGIVTTSRTQGRVLSLVSNSVASLVKQARKLISVALTGLIAESKFTAADNTLLVGGGYVPDLGPVWSGGAAGYKIVSNQLEQKTNSFAHAILTNLGTDLRVEFDVIAIAPGTAVPVSIIIRRQDGANYWEFFYDIGNGWQLDKVIGGADNFIGTPVATTTGHVVFEAKGNLLTGTAPGGAQRSTTDASFNSATSVAIIMRGDGVNASIIDNFQVFAGGVLVIKQVNKSLTPVTSSSVASILKRAGKMLSVVGTQVASAVAFKTAIKFLFVNSSETVTVIKTAGKVSSVTGTGTVTLPRFISRLLSLVSTSIASLVKRPAKTFSISSSETVSVIRQPVKVVPVTGSGSVVLQKVGQKVIALTSTGQALLGKLVYKFVSTVTATEVASITKRPAKGIVAQSTASPVVVKSASKPISLTVAGTVAMVKQSGLVRTVQVTGAAVVSRLVQKFVTVATIAALSIRKDVSKRIGVDAGPVPVITLRALVRVTLQAAGQAAVTKTSLRLISVVALQTVYVIRMPMVRITKIVIGAASFTMKWLHILRGRLRAAGGNSNKLSVDGPTNKKRATGDDNKTKVRDPFEE